MLRKLVTLTLLVVLTILGAPQAVATPEDDGDKISGYWSIFATGKSGRKISHKDLILYRGRWVTLKRFESLAQACERSGGTECRAVDVVEIGRSDFRAIAVRLVTELRLPVPSPTFGPDPSVNEWKMLAVGFPIWLWTDGARTLTDTDSADGFTFTLTARLRSTTFAMGDGHAVTCRSMSRYSDAVRPGTPSPDCGYSYQVPSLPKGNYTVTATAYWDVAWSVDGISGTLPVIRTASRSLPIGELSALNR